MISSTNEMTADTEYDVHHLIRERWSPRVFSHRSIGENEIKQLLEAVRWSPSSLNEQPWRLIYAHRGSKAYEQIFECLSEFNQKWVKHAPVLILTAYKEKFSSGKENFHALHDLGLAMGSLSFQAQYMGIALHHMAGLDWQKAQKVFDVPEGYHATTAVAMGYYGGEVNDLPASLQESETEERKRKSQETFAAEGKWPKG